MIAKFHHSNASLDVPEHAGHVAGRGDDLSVIDKSTAREITGVGTQFTGTLNGTDTALFGTEVVNRANVIETTAGNKVARGRVCAGHDPGGAQGDGMDLVGRVGVPDDELAVLGGGDEMALVSSPVHGVNFC